MSGSQRTDKPIQSFPPEAMFAGRSSGSLLADRGTEEPGEKMQTCGMVWHDVYR